MSQQCTHILASGQKCHAPAIKGESLCRHHHPLKPAPEDRRFVLPPLNDESSILYAATEIVQALAERRLQRRNAATLLFGLRLAANLMKDIDQEARRAVAAGLDAPGEPCEEDFDCDQTPPELTMEEAKALLATLQTTSVDKVLDQLQARNSSRASKPNLEHSQSSCPPSLAVMVGNQGRSAVPPSTSTHTLKPGVISPLPCIK